MISQIFISPDSFENNNDFTSINSLLNDLNNSPIFMIDFEKNMSLINYVSKNYLNTYETRFKDILIRKLNKLHKAKKFFKRNNHNINIDKDDDWLKLAYLSEQDQAFDLVISGENYISKYRSKFVGKSECVNDIVVFPEKWDLVKLTDTEVKKTPSDYERAFGDILKHSKKLKIIDVYIGKKFDHGKKQFSGDDRKIIESFSKLLSENKSGKGVIEIHTMLDEYLNLNYVLPRNELEIKTREKYNSDDDYKRKRDNWKKVMQKFSDEYGHTYKVYFWSNRKKKSTFHDRYIFTDLIGVSPNHSISATEDSDQDTLWKVLNRTDREKQEAKYDFDDPYFIPSCEPIEVEPNE